MKNFIRERTARIRDIFPNLKNKKGLYGELVLPRHIFSNLRSACKLVLYDCLTSFYTHDAFDMDLPIEKFCRTYKAEILRLPNITPNGLVMPKLEILNSVNFLNKAIFHLIDFLQLKGKCDIACPVNLRVNFGVDRNAAFDARPKSSTNWHTDIWAGQNAHELMIHTPIFGDFSKSGIAVSPPPADFFPDFVRSLDGYKDGLPITKDMDATAYKSVLIAGRSYVFDSFLFHKTISNSPDMRGIISFPIKLKRKIPSDIYRNPLRDGEYRSYGEWRKMGTETFLKSERKLADTHFRKTTDNMYADTFDVARLTSV